MFIRDIANSLTLIATQLPVITVTGPRQSGKTTLTKHIFDKKSYFNLENPDLRNRIKIDPRSFLESVDEHGVIIDEIQHIPELFSYIQAYVDEKNIMGQFILTGSYNLSLLNSVSQSLAGRTAILELLPLSLHEIKSITHNISIDTFLLSGGLPRIFKQNLNPNSTYRDYVRTYLERDMRTLINVKDLSQFQQFLTLCASRVGQEFNATSLGNEIGISYHTVQQWVSVLEASYILYRLKPYFANTGKTVVKRPKLYFTDVGVATYLLGIEEEKQLTTHPLRGQLFENLIITELLKAFLHHNKTPQLFYYRDKSQNEVDVIIRKGNELVPIEIKSSKTFRTQFLKGLDYFSKAFKENVSKGYLIYAGEGNINIRNYELVHYMNTQDIIFYE